MQPAPPAAGRSRKEPGVGPKPRPAIPRRRNCTSIIAALRRRVRPVAVIVKGLGVGVALLADERDAGAEAGQGEGAVVDRERERLRLVLTRLAVDGAVGKAAALVFGALQEARRPTVKPASSASAVPRLACGPWLRQCSPPAQFSVWRRSHIRQTHRATRRSGSPDIKASGDRGGRCAVPVRSARGRATSRAVARANG